MDSHSHHNARKENLTINSNMQEKLGKCAVINLISINICILKEKILEKEQTCENKCSCYKIV